MLQREAVNMPEVIRCPRCGASITVEDGRIVDVEEGAESIIEGADYRFRSKECPNGGDKK